MLFNLLIGRCYLRANVVKFSDVIAEFRLKNVTDLPFFHIEDHFFKTWHHFPAGKKSQIQTGATAIGIFIAHRFKIFAGIQLRFDLFHNF